MGVEGKMLLTSPVLSSEAKDALGKILLGMRLAIPRCNCDSVPCMLLNPRNYTPNHKHGDQQIPKPTADELVNSGIIRELTEERILNSNSSFVGWKEMKLPGETYKLYACIQ